MVDVSALDAIITQFKTRGFGEIVPSFDHNIQNDAIKVIRDILAGITVDGVGEGDFSAWSMISETGEDVSYTPVNLQISSTGRKVFYWGDAWPAYRLYVINIDAETMSDTGLRSTYTGLMSLTSMTGKYDVLVENTSKNIQILKDGAIFSALNPTEVGGQYMYPLAISGDGKFIACYYENGDTGDRYIRVFEGV